jgi:Nuclease subunit of the excinuclease complex
MGRRSKYREFLHTLQEILDLKGAALAKSLGKQPTNLSQHLSGAKKVGRGTLRSGLYHLGEWRVKAFQEVQPIPVSLTALPKTPGVYALFDSAGAVLYAGQASNLQTEIRQTLNRSTNFPVRLGPQLSKKARPRFKTLATFLSVYEVPSHRLRHNLEALLLRTFPNQSHNNKLGKFR